MEQNFCVCTSTVVIETICLFTVERSGMGKLTVVFGTCISVFGAAAVTAITTITIMVIAGSDMVVTRHGLFPFTLIHIFRSSKYVGRWDPNFYTIPLPP